MNTIIICTYDPELVPSKKTEGSVCRDLKVESDIVIEAGNIHAVNVGIKTFLPLGRHAKTYARSSLPKKMGLMKANNVGIFDADYRGEYIMQLYNFTKHDTMVEKYTRITQLEFAPYYVGSKNYGGGHTGQLDIPSLEIIVDQDVYDNFAQLYPTQRGEGGLGSTGEK